MAQHRSTCNTSKPQLMLRKPSRLQFMTLRHVKTSSSAMADRPCDCLRLKNSFAVVGTASGSVQGRSGTRYAVAIRQARKTRTEWPGWNNNLNRYVLDHAAQNISVCRRVIVLWRWFTFGEYLTGKGVLPTNQCWCQKTRAIAVLCGIKISAVHHLVLSQYMHQTVRWRVRQTDRQIELWQQYRVLH